MITVMTTVAAGTVGYWAVTGMLANGIHTGRHLVKAVGYAAGGKFPSAAKEVGCAVICPLVDLGIQGGAAVAEISSMVGRPVFEGIAVEGALRRALEDRLGFLNKETGLPVDLPVNDGPDKVRQQTLSREANELIDAVLNGKGGAQAG